MVFIGYGFGGVKFFQKKENAENYIKENGGTLEIELATTKEYFIQLKGNDLLCQS